ncbi:GGDEF domain-containing protein [Aquabacterium lacunae]|nr:GGDEF domain-containing protein [Aquabacterium lacunae]
MNPPARSLDRVLQSSASSGRGDDPSMPLSQGGEALRVATPWAHIDRALEQPAWRLRFEPELEATFESATLGERRAVFVRASQWLPPAMALLILADRFMIPDVWGMAVMVRLVGMAPYALFAHLASQMVMSSMAMQKLQAVGTISAVLLHLCLVLASGSVLAQEYLVASAMHIMYTAAFLRMRLVPGLWTIVGTVGLTFAAQLLLPAPEQSLTIGLPVFLILLSSAVMVVYALFHLEKESRRNHLLTLKQGMIRQDLQDTIQQIEAMARVDALTQLPNKRQFQKHFERTWARLLVDEAPVSVLLIDVDHLADHNAAHGARHGDACLQAVARAIQASLRRPNDFVARTDDDEFMVVLGHTGAEPARVVGERILAASRMLHLDEDQALRHPVRLSLGVSCLPQVSEFDTPEALIAMARHALAGAKRQGGDRMQVSWQERPAP